MESSGKSEISPNLFSALPPPLIYLITRGEATAENFSEKSAEILCLIKTAVQSQISLIQIREKQLPARLVFDLTEKAARLTRGSQTRLLVNDRADIAFLANADGVHLNSLSLPAEPIRRAFPKNFIVGVSAHTLVEIESSKQQGADFATFSPIFFTPGKGAPEGLAELKRVCQQVKPFPVIALGGINETNYKSTIEAGASGFAAIRFLNQAENLPKIKIDCERQREIN